MKQGAFHDEASTRAEADIAAFGKLYPMNARLVQKDFRRFVLRS
jgi:carbonic anhydrase